jgi:hypothetical protein
LRVSLANQFQFRHSVATDAGARSAGFGQRR